MKLTDWFVRTLVAVTFVALLVAPEKWGGLLVLVCFAVMGTWSML